MIFTVILSLAVLVLAAAVGVAARQRTCVPHSGDCVSYGRQTPYLPWGGIVTSILGLSTRRSVEQRTVFPAHVFYTVLALMTGNGGVLP